MNPAERLRIHGPLVPMEPVSFWSRVRRTIRLYREIKAEEARLARSEGEKPQPGLTVGTIYALCAVAIGLFWVGVAALAIGVLK